MSGKNKSVVLSFKMEKMKSSSFYFFFLSNLSPCRHDPALSPGDRDSRCRCRCRPERPTCRLRVVWAGTERETQQVSNRAEQLRQVSRPPTAATALPLVCGAAESGEVTVVPGSRFVRAGLEGDTLGALPRVLSGLPRRRTSQRSASCGCLGSL